MSKSDQIYILFSAYFLIDSGEIAKEREGQHLAFVREYQLSRYDPAIRLLIIEMNDFEILQAVITNVHFRVFEAYAKKLQFPVVLKQCDYSKDEEAEFFIRSVLVKAKNNTYSQPLVSIFADIDAATGKTFIVFVWKKGSALDREIEREQESQSPSAMADFEQVKVIYKSPQTTLKQALCVSLGKNVTLKVSTHIDILDLNPTFEEALKLVQCTHPNTCEFLDFRLFSTKKGKHRAYIVMELLDQDLAKEIEERKSLTRPYGELELLKILLDVSAALVHAKSVNIAHGDIKPFNMLRTPQGVKLSNFGFIWPKGLKISNIEGPYMSPEALGTLDCSELLQRPFESDVFSLGMLMLHLASLELPYREMGGRELDELQQVVKGLRYSDEFKRLVAAMLSASPQDRPLIETVRDGAESIQLAQQALSDYEEEKYEEAVKLRAAAHTIYSRLPDEKATANNLMNWGMALRKIEKYTEAEEKHVAAAALLSRFPHDKDTALNFSHWGNPLLNMADYAEAEKKYAAAAAIFSRFPSDKDTAYNLIGWGLALTKMKNYVEAERKHSAADFIYASLPNCKDAAENLILWAYTLCEMGNNEEALRKHAAADSIFSHFSCNSRINAYNLMWWGDTLENMGRKKEAMDKYVEADIAHSRLLIDQIPFFHLNKWTSVLLKMEKGEKALALFASAEAKYSRLSNNKFAAKALYEWANALKGMGNKEEALKKYAEADAIFSTFFPNDEDTAVNLNVWACALQEAHRCEEAARKFAVADSILFRLCPHGRNTAINLKNWADVLCEMGNKEEGFRKFAAANSLFAQLPGDRFAAENLYCWGNALRKIQNNEEAVKKFAAVDAISSRLPSTIITANSLYFWGISLSNMGRRAEAIAKLEEARAIYASLGQNTDAEVCDRKIANLP